MIDLKVAVDHQQREVHKVAQELSTNLHENFKFNVKKVKIWMIEASNTDEYTRNPFKTQFSQMNCKWLYRDTCAAE